jgi:aminomethyltransferase
MPVQFTSILDEHQAVRQASGLFDISHMGELFVSGPAALTWLQGMLANDLGKCPVGGAQYTFLLNPQGGVIDDLIVYRLEADRFLLLVNAAKVEEDAAWLREHATPDAILDDRSGQMGGLALQGPASSAVYRAVFHSDPPARNTVAACSWRGFDFLVAGTGYTGEAGCEFFFPVDAAQELWNALVGAGARPCGLGARDTLRLEMCYPLNGSDLSPDRTPLEAGLGMFVSLEKGDFIGRDALVAQKAAGVPARLVALRMTEKAPPPRAHYPVLCDGAVVGETTSGALSPTRSEGIALAYLPSQLAQPGRKVQVDIRGRCFDAVIEKKPFYRPTSTSAS